MNPNKFKYPKSVGIREFVSTGKSLQVGGFLIRQLSDKSIWIENEIGEGMQSDTARVESLLRNFHADNF